MKIKFSEAGSWQTTEAKPGLTLYIPAIRRIVTLNRKHISFGSSKFRDLDLSQVPGWEQAPANLGDFRFEDGVWYLEPRQGAEDLRVNGWPQDRECRAVKLEPGDRIEIGDARLVIRGCAEPGVSGGPELEQNFVLMFQSISLNRGHIGIQIRFDAARRVLIREDWGIVGDKKLTDPPQERPVPEDITTREQLYRFANRSGWEYCSEPEKMYDQDVLLWLSPEAQVQYIAEKGEVLYRKWVPDADGDPELQEYWSRFVRTCPDEGEIRDYIRRTWAHFPHNRRGDLDSDLVLSMPADENKLTYVAENRMVVRSPGRQETEEKTMAIPESVKTRDELIWYMKTHALDWMPRHERRDEMLCDRILASGIRWNRLRVIHWQTHYRSLDRTVVHIPDMSKPEETSEPLKIPFHVFAVQFLPDYVKKHRPEWMK